MLLSPISWWDSLPLGEAKKLAILNLKKTPQHLNEKSARHKPQILQVLNAGEEEK